MAHDKTVLLLQGFLCFKQGDIVLVYLGKFIYKLYNSNRRKIGSNTLFKNIFRKGIFCWKCYCLLYFWQLNFWNILIWFYLRGLHSSFFEVLVVTFNNLHGFYFLLKQFFNLDVFMISFLKFLVINGLLLYLDIFVLIGACLLQVFLKTSSNSLYVLRLKFSISILVVVATKFYMTYRYSWVGFLWSLLIL